MQTCPSCESLTGFITLSCPSCGSNLILDPGTIIAGRYEILERLGRGGMGTVYRATDRDLDQNVAIKFIAVGSHPQAGARFKSEIRLARKVRHRNVCAVWQNGYEGELAYIVMELIEGRTLRELVKETGPLAWSRACDLALQAAQGLEAIHEAGVIHRDVKTSNLMIDERGVVRVMDFGIAKGNPTQPGLDLTVDPRITGSDQVVGSPEYMSPEQIHGFPLDARTDIYSFGIVLYELFTGRVPFRGTSAFDTMMLHVKAPPPLEGPDAATIPPAVVPILERTLAKSREDRYPSTRVLMKDLRRVRAAFDDSHTETDSSIAPARWWRRSALWAPAAGLLLGLGALRALSSSEAPPSAVPTTTSLASDPVAPSPAVAIASPIPAEDSQAGGAPTAGSDSGEKRPLSSPPRRTKEPGPPRTGNGIAVSDGAPIAGSTPRPVAVGTSPTGEMTSAPPATLVVVLPRTAAASPAAPAFPPPIRGQLFREGEQDLVRPACLECPTAYPSNLERERLEGVVPVELLVDEEGRVQQPRALGTARRELKAAAVDSVKRWQFRPASRQGVPGKMVVVVEVSFRLDGTAR